MCQRMQHLQQSHRANISKHVHSPEARPHSTDVRGEHSIGQGSRNLPRRLQLADAIAEHRKDDK